MHDDGKDRKEDIVSTIDIDSTIYEGGDDEEEWVPTIVQRIVAGFVIALIFVLIGIVFWEDIKLGLGFGIVIFVFAVVFGEKFLKILAAILRITGPV